MSWADAGSANESASATTQSVVVAVMIVMPGTAPEAACIVGAPRAFVNRRRRVRTQRALSRDGSGRIVARVLGGDDFRRRLAVLHPAFERAQQIVLRVHRRRRQRERAAESVRARAAAAVLHGGHHEQPEEFLHFSQRLAPRVARGARRWEKCRNSSGCSWCPPWSTAAAARARTLSAARSRCRRRRWTRSTIC